MSCGYTISSVIYVFTVLISSETQVYHGGLIWNLDGSLLVLQVFYMRIRIGSMHAQAVVSLGIQKQLYKVASFTPPFL